MFMQGERRGIGQIVEALSVELFLDAEVVVDGFELDRFAGAVLWSELVGEGVLEGHGVQCAVLSERFLH
jgi:hypothetical protein